MLRGLWLKSARLMLTGSAALLLTVGGARGDDKDLKELRERMEKLESQNVELRQKLDSVQQPAGANPAMAPAATSPAGTIQLMAGEEQEQAGLVKPPDDKSIWLPVGKNLGMKAYWNYGLWLATEDDAFRIHLGGRAHLDGVWAAPANHIQTGKGGTGKFDDGSNWRRVRLEADGWMYEVVDFFFEVDFDQSVNDDPTLPANAFTNVIAPNSVTEAYVSVNHIPGIGIIRAGNQKPPIELEHLISSRWLDFMERSPIFDTYFNRCNGFSPGIQLLNWSENERLTWQLGFFKNAQTTQPWATGDGGYQVNGRFTCLPLYRDEGRCMIHIGCGVQYDEPDHQTAILRDRWLLRNGPPTTQNTVALASIVGHDQFMAVPEFFMNLGPLSVQAEYMVHHMDEIAGFTTQSQGTVALAPGARKNFFSQGVYVQAMYFLTGENRPYDRTGQHTGGARPTRVVPFRNFFWVPGDSGRIFSTGAWQVGARYSYNDLSNNGINGGQINEGTVGINWFLNPNVKIQWNYDVGYRGQLGAGVPTNGVYQGFGTRLAFDW